MKNQKNTQDSRGLIEKIISADPPRTVYIVVFALYILLSGTVSYFHEPWLDEAQSWLIARDASYHDMLFVLPHYEGHPALWWLILSVPAKLGAPYELALEIIMLMISSMSAYMIMFRSPMPPIVRLLLPFTYFFFYQYGIIARPYGLLILGFLLAAYTFKRKDEKPFPHVLSLMLLCSSSAFGILISGGLAMVWCFRILSEYGGFKGIFTKFIKTKRFAALLLLLCWAMGTIFSILSYEDTFANDTVSVTLPVMLQGLWYMFFMLPADCMLMGSGPGLGTALKYNTFAPQSIAVMSLPGGLLLLVLAAYVHRRGKLPEFLVPYSLLAVFASLVYFNTHHIGTAAVFYVFIFWICCDSENVRGPLSEKVAAHIPENALSVSPENMGRIVNTVMLGLCLVMGMTFSAFASVKDIQCSYFYGRDAADYIKENGFEELNIMSSWYYEHDQYDYIIVSADKQHPATNISPYFDENIFFNYNYGDRSRAYILHRLSEEANEEQYALWRETVPDILISEPHLEFVYTDGSVRRSDYILIKTIPYTQIMKLNGAENYLCIYMRRDLLAQYYPDILPENPADMEFIQEYIS